MKSKDIAIQPEVVSEEGALIPRSNPHPVFDPAKLKPHQQEHLEKIEKGFATFKQGLEDVANAYREAVDVDPAMRAVIKARYPDTSQDFWDNLEAVARGILDKRLFNYVGPHKKKLTSLSPHDQQRMLEEGVDVAEEQTDGSIDFRRLKLKDMSGDQVKRIVDNGSIRSIASQRTQLQKEIIKRKTQANAAAIAKHSAVQKVTVTQPYVEGPKGVLFQGACHVSWADLRKMVQKHDKKA